MNELSGSVTNLRKKYREIFHKSHEEIKHRIEEIMPEKSCENCKAADCKVKSSAGDIFSVFPEGCKYRAWQNAVLRMLEQDISKQIFLEWKRILAYRKNFSCSGCAVCCNLACSEFSLEQLQAKALNNDNFAKQFLSVFIPYSSKEEARKIYPEYIKMLEENKEEEVYFYHCPKLTQNNKCCDYENRPQICRDFPDNPLSILPKSCGFYKWKSEVEETALILHSALEITGWYKQKIPRYYE